MANNIIVNSRKFDGKIHRSWEAQIIEQTGSLLVLAGVFEKEIRHPHLGVIRRGTISYEYYWLDRWYNVFKFHEPEGDLRNFYCNINLPPKFENGILDYVDLEIDVLVWSDFRLQFLDLEEFEQNAIFYQYSEELILKTKQTLNELQKLIEARAFPFSPE